MVTEQNDAKAVGSTSREGFLIYQNFRLMETAMARDVNGHHRHHQRHDILTIQLLQRCNKYSSIIVVADWNLPPLPPPSSCTTDPPCVTVMPLPVG